MELRKSCAAALIAALFLSAGSLYAEYKAEVRGNHLRFELSLCELSNLVYQLDCLSGLLPGSLPAYRELWFSQLGWDADDSNLMGRWEAIHRGVGEPSPSVLVQKWGISYPPSYFTPEEPLKRLIAAGIRSTSMEEFRENISHYLQQSDVEELVKIVHHFRARFKTWWDNGAETEGLRNTRRITESLERHHLVEYAEEVGPFFEVDLTQMTTFSVDLLVRPKTTREQIEGGHDARSMQAGGRAFIETAYDPATPRQAEPLLHEFVHYLHSQSPLERRIEFVRACQAVDNPNALNLYNILDEVLATSIGNALVARQMMYGRDFLRVLYKDQSLYGDRIVDRVAKALIPTIRDRMDDGKSLFDGFAPKYLEVAQSALGDLAESPLLALRFRSISCQDPELQTLVPIFRARVPGVSSIVNWSFAGWTHGTFRDLNSVVFIPTDRLKESLEALGNPILQASTSLEILTHRYEAFVFRIPRTRQSSLYLFVGDNAEVISDLLRTFSTHDSSFEGFGIGRERSIGPLAGSQ